MSSSPSWLGQILLEHSTSKYFIKYGGYFSNHLAHGIIALERLGATEQRVDKYISRYVSRLEKLQEADHDVEPVDAAPPSSEDAEKLIGKRKSFYSLLNYYRNKLTECGSKDLFVKTYFPKLSEGIAASLLHGMIHVGYGFAANSDQILCEGMEYLHLSHVAVKYNHEASENNVELFGKGHTNILEVLTKIKADDHMKTVMMQGEEKFRNSSWYASSLQYRKAAILAEGDIMIKYANEIKVAVDEFSCESEGNPIIRLSDWLLDQSILVYTFASNKSDFGLLHGVTCAWSLRQIIANLDYQDAFIALRSFTCVLLATYITQECPAVKLGEVGIPSDGQSTWKDIIEETLAREADEHRYKLTQVCFECWKTLKDKSTQMAGVYVAAARACLDNEYFFVRH